jgi:rod shape-determining protein MreD
MRALLILASLLGLIALQMKLLPYLEIAGVKPDLFLFAACSLSQKGGPTRGALWGFALGLLEDGLSLSPLGMRALGFALVGYLLGVAGRDLFLEALPFQVLLLFLAGIVSGAVTLISLNFFLIPRPVAPTIFRLLLPESIVTALWGGVLLLIWRRLKAFKAA